MDQLIVCKFNFMTHIFARIDYDWLKILTNQIIELKNNVLNKIWSNCSIIDLCIIYNYIYQIRLV